VRCGFLKPPRASATIRAPWALALALCPAPSPARRPAPCIPRHGRRADHQRRHVYSGTDAATDTESVRESAPESVPVSAPELALGGGGGAGVVGPAHRLEI